MKSKFFISLLLASAISSGFSSSTVSTLSQRDEMIINAFKDKSPEEALKEINKKQQDGDVKADNQDYVVIVKSEGNDTYTRVAHSQSDKVGKVVEPALVPMMKDAEKKLGINAGPVEFELTGQKTLYAVIEKRGEYLIFNICPTKDEVDGLLKAKRGSAVEIIPAPPAISPITSEPAKIETKAEVKEDVKPASAHVEAVTTIEPAKEASTPITEAPAVATSAPASENTETPRVHQ